MHKCHMIIDLQFGSTGKGLIAGYLAKREDYDLAVCSFATNAGHTYIDNDRFGTMMTQQLPTAISSPTVKKVLLGPGALIHARTLAKELRDYAELMEGKQLMIHPHAAIVEDYHADLEIEWGMTKMGSTAKGVGAAAIERIRRVPQKYPDAPGPNIAKIRLRGPLGFDLGRYVVTAEEYRAALEAAESVIVEGAQGYSLSMYHGFYPYTTSRDVTPWQIAADCGLPFKWAPYVQVVGTLRTFPIRVNHRDGNSGPPYPDQREVDWAELKVEPELTTVTKLPRRIFTFSHEQMVWANWHCGGYWDTKLFLNFANYMPELSDLKNLIRKIETPCEFALNPGKVAWIGFGPADHQLVPRDQYERLFCATDSEGGEL